MHRIVMHIDMDAFFAAIEQRDNPDLAGLPVIIGAMPGGRGVVSTCSYEARAFGVHSAMPISGAYRRCPQAVYLHPDMERYSAVSKEIMVLLTQISPVVEPVSIDEAYVDITGLERLWGTPREIGEKTREIIKSRLSLTASVGIGPNRMVAKIASDHQKPDGLTVVLPEQVLDFLAPMPVGTLRGVGKVMVEKLHRLGIHTVADLRSWPNKSLVKRFGEKGGEHLFCQARGIASDHVGSVQGRKSISKERTFGEDVADLEKLRSTLLNLATGVCRIGRKENKKGQVVSIKIRLRNFESHTRQTRLACPTNSDKIIFEAGWSLFEKSLYKGKMIRLIGIGISDWEDEKGRQLDLLAPAGEKENQLYRAMDKITDKYGNTSINVAAAIRKKKDS